MIIKCIYCARISSSNLTFSISSKSNINWHCHVIESNSHAVCFGLNLIGSIGIAIHMCRSTLSSFTWLPFRDLRCIKSSSLDIINNTSLSNTTRLSMDTNLTTSFTSRKYIKWQFTWWCTCGMKNVLDWVSSGAEAAHRCVVMQFCHRNDIKLNLKWSHSCVIRAAAAASVGKC